MNKRYKRGEVIMVDLGEVGSKQIIGREQGKTRPCIIIKSLHRIGSLIILLITSSKPKSLRYYNVKILKGEENLTYDSYVLCHQIRTVSTDRVIEKIGSLPSLANNKIRNILLDLLD